MPQEMPTVPVNFVPAKAGEIIKLGAITCRVMEDGSRSGELQLQTADAEASHAHANRSVVRQSNWLC
jgi:hypothetical protein